MDKKDLLHKVIQGMDPYISTGVPKIYWNIAHELTMEIYGDKGIFILESFHKEYEDSVDCNTISILHYLHGFEQDSNREILPDDIIGKLELLKEVTAK